MSERNDLIERLRLCSLGIGDMRTDRSSLGIFMDAADEIRRLEAEVEAGKREHNATAARFARLHTIASKIRWADLGQPAMEVASTQEGLTELSQFLLQNALEECLDRQGLPRTEGERA